MCEFIITRETKRTRRLHHCFWCNELIPVGSSTTRQSWKYDGEVNFGHFHKECYEASGKWWNLNREWAEEGYMPGSFKRGSIEER